MNEYDIIVIGGGPAGVQAAISARNTYPSKTIALIRKEEIALIPCGIPYIFHSLSSVEDNILSDGLLEEKRIQLIIGKVVRRDNSTLILADNRKMTFEKLVVAVGSSPIEPAIPGRNNNNVYTLSKQFDTLNKIHEKSKSAKRILIIGGGYVGIELAYEFAQAGKSVIIVEKMPHLLPTSVDSEFTEEIKRELENSGIEIKTENSLKALKESEETSYAVLENEDHIIFDIVIISVGFRPNIDIARTLGVTFDPKFGIIVDEYLRTSDKNVFAVGDCVIKHNFISGELESNMLASTAMAQGRLAGANLFSINLIKAYQGTLGSFITKIGKISLGVTGLTETKAKEMGIEYVVGFARSIDHHPVKLPDSTEVKIKLIFARYSHLLLGAELVGGDSVGELINMLSVMIQKKMTDTEIDTLQIGTHPLLTPSPLAYPVINASVDAIMKWYNEKHESENKHDDNALPPIQGQDLEKDIEKQKSENKLDDNALPPIQGQDLEKDIEKPKSEIKHDNFMPPILPGEDYQRSRL